MFYVVLYHDTLTPIFLRTTSADTFICCQFIRTWFQSFLTYRRLISYVGRKGVANTKERSGSRCGTHARHTWRAECAIIHTRILMPYLVGGAWRRLDLSDLDASRMRLGAHQDYFRSTLLLRTPILWGWIWWAEHDGASTYEIWPHWERGLVCIWIISGLAGPAVIVIFVIWSGLFIYGCWRYNTAHCSF